VVILMIVNRPQDYSQYIPCGNHSARIMLANCPCWVRMNEYAARASLVLGRQQGRLQHRA
jgi:hypothetical protein